MSASPPRADARAVHVAAGDDELTFTLADGRRLAVPIAWFPRLLRANSRQRQHWRLLGDGAGVHWPELDEDIAIEALLGR